MRALTMTLVSRTASTSAPSLGSAPHFRDRFPNLLLDRLVRNVLVLFPVLLDELQDAAPRAFDRLIALGRDDDGHDLAGALDDDLVSTVVDALQELSQLPSRLRGGPLTLHGDPSSGAIYTSISIMSTSCPPRPPEAAPSPLG